MTIRPLYLASCLAALLLGVAIGIWIRPPPQDGDVISDGKSEFENETVDVPVFVLCAEEIEQVVAELRDDGYVVTRGWFGHGGMLDEVINGWYSVEIPVEEWLESGLDPNNQGYNKIASRFRLDCFPDTERTISDASEFPPLFPFDARFGSQEFVLVLADKNRRRYFNRDPELLPPVSEK